MRSDVPDFDFLRIRVETKMDSTITAKTSVPLEHLPRTAMGRESPCRPESGILHPLSVLRCYFRSPRGRRPTLDLPLLRRPVQRDQLPKDGWKQIRGILEVGLDTRPEGKVREDLLAILPQGNGITSCAEPNAVPFANGVGVFRTCELVDLLKRFPDRFVGQQLVEADRDSIAVPVRCEVELRSEPRAKRLA